MIGAFVHTERYSYGIRHFRTCHFRKVQDLDLPLYRNLLMLAFEVPITATIVLPNIVSLSPAAVEMLDHTAISSQENATSGPAGSLLFVEVANDDLKDVERRLSLCKGDTFHFSSLNIQADIFNISANQLL